MALYQCHLFLADCGHVGRASFCGVVFIVLDDRKARCRLAEDEEETFGLPAKFACLGCGTIRPCEPGGACRVDGWGRAVTCLPRPCLERGKTVDEPGQFLFTHRRLSIEARFCGVGAIDAGPQRCHGRGGCLACRVARQECGKGDARCEGKNQGRCAARAER